MLPSQSCERSIAPISRPPPVILIGVFTKLSSSMDLKNGILVSKTWSILVSLHEEGSFLTDSAFLDLPKKLAFDTGPYSLPSAPR